MSEFHKVLAVFGVIAALALTGIAGPVQAGATETNGVSVIVAGLSDTGSDQAGQQAADRVVVECGGQVAASVADGSAAPAWTNADCERNWIWDMNFCNNHFPIGSGFNDSCQTLAIAKLAACLATAGD
ncbi:MAG: hypothetical protein LBV06_00515 [Propionibacteriaceae bacterium]|jgi:hypothetical protein|nr:hypothetical protein [Propionibacteriaceae bacterium]